VNGKNAKGSQSQGNVDFEEYNTEVVKLWKEWMMKSLARFLFSGL